MVTEKEILDSLRHIVDPDLGRDIVSLGFVKDIKIDGGKVSFAIELTTPACPVKKIFKERSEQAVAALPGVESVEVTMTAQAPRHRPVPEADGLAGVDTIIAVSSCKGGVGKSTVAAHLARAMQREGHSVGLLDADIFGPSIPTLFKIHRPDIYASENMILPIEKDGLKLMSLGFLLGESPAVMRGPMVSGYTQQILHQTKWDKLDYLIIDMPPGTGDIQLTIVQQTKLDGAIIVTTPQALSLVDVARGILMFERVDVPVLGLVENMSYFVCDGCGKKHQVFGSSTDSLQRRFGLDLLAELPILPSLAASEEGDGAADAFAKMAENVHRAVGKRRAQKAAQPTATAAPGFVQVKWPDGREALIPNRLVRLSCPCAHCVDEFTGQKTLDDATVPHDIQIQEIVPLGNYAVSISWSDGHSTGIYSWDLLRDLARRG